MSNSKLSVRAVLFASLEHRLFDLGWFPERIPPGIVAKALGACVELKVSDLADDDLAYDYALELLRREFCLSLLRAKSTLVVVEHKPRSPSRVRSHKGLAKQLSLAAGRDVEYSIGESHTLMIAFVPLSPANCERGFEQLLDSSQSFVLFHTDFENVPGLLGSPERWCSVEDVARVDYMKLVPIARKHELGVLSMGIDSRGDFVNLRLFDSPRNCADVMRLVE